MTWIGKHRAPEPTAAPSLEAILKAAIKVQDGRIRQAAGDTNAYNGVSVADRATIRDVTGR